MNNNNSRDMLNNAPLIKCFNTAAHLFTQALAFIETTCKTVAVLAAAENAETMEAELGAIRGRAGEYFPAGVDFATIQERFTKVVQSLNTSARTARAVAGQPAPTEYAPPVFPAASVVPPQALNETQRALFNACVEVVRYKIAGACWYLKLTNRADYEAGAAVAIERFGDAYPYDADDERAALDAMGVIAPELDTIRAALSIENYPEIDRLLAKKYCIYFGGPVDRVTVNDGGEIVRKKIDVNNWDWLDFAP